MREAIRSIKDSFSRSVFYWLTFMLTSMFMFVFFNLSYNDSVGVTFINATNNSSLLITVLVIAVCMIVIFFANDFYVKKKSKDLAIRLVCGGTFMQIAFHTLFQTLVLFILAIPVGIGLAYILIPVLQQLIYIITHENVHLTIMYRAIISTTLIISVEIVFCTVLNVGYVYRSSIRVLLNDGKTTKISFKIPLISFSKKTKQILYTILYLLPIVIMYLNYKNQESILVFSVMGMIGLNGFMSNVVIEKMNDLIEGKINHAQLIAYTGLIRNNLRVLKNNIILIITSDVLIIAIMTGAKSAIEMMICIISFVVINVLLTLAIMFKFSSEIVGRRKNYSILSQIGYLESEQKKIMRKEVLGFYGLILIFILLYLVNILIILTLHHVLSFNVSCILLILFIMPFIITGIGSYLYYYNEVWGKKNV